jgi:hypothetical protein
VFGSPWKARHVHSICSFRRSFEIRMGMIEFSALTYARMPSLSLSFRVPACLARPSLSPCTKRVPAARSRRTNEAQKMVAIYWSESSVRFTVWDSLYLESFGNSCECVCDTPRRIAHLSFFISSVWERSLGSSAAPLTFVLAQHQHLKQADRETFLVELLSERDFVLVCIVCLHVLHAPRCACD